MKKLNILLISIFSISSLYAQDITDAVRYSQSEIQGTARFRALSGAFGALGGDMSAVSINPASSAVFSQSQVSFSFVSDNTDNKTNYFNGFNASNESTFDLNQLGVAFVFENSSNEPWRKISLGIAYDKNNNFNDNWSAIGTNTNYENFNNTIASYFYEYANGLPLEIIDRPYDYLGFADQQAHLGYKSYILNPIAETLDNKEYKINVAEGNFNHNYNYTALGYNGKVSFNLAGQYEDKLYLGLNLNSHFLDYQKTTFITETNSNSDVANNSNPNINEINEIHFKNSLATSGSGFSFQLGGIYKINQELRLGLTYESSTWLRIDEEATQFVFASTNDNNGLDGKNTPNDKFNSITIDPNTINIYPTYRLQTPGKTTASIAYVFGKKGLLSFDYSTKNYSRIKFRPISDPDFIFENNYISNTLTRAATYRVGGEYKIKQFSFRGGYRLEESPYKNKTTIGDLTGYSLGLGYNFGNTKLDITYDTWNQTNKTPLYNVGLIDTATINRTNSNVTLSLSINI